MMKKLNISFQILGSLLIALLFTGCDTNSDPPKTELTISSVRINGSNFSNDMTNIPLDGSIEVAFSSTLNSEGFAEAFSLSDSQGEATYNISLASAGSKAVVSYTGLNPNSSYNLSINTMAIGSNGEALSTQFSRSFTTTEAEDTKTPCTSATEECMQQLEITESLSFEFYSTFDIVSDTDYVWDEIEEVVFSVHGQNRDADNYFRYMTNSLGDAGMLENTLVISPYFKEESGATDTELFWGSDWRTGSDSGNSQVNISSFSVLDVMIDYLSDQEKFPNLRKITIAGHSSGAAFAQHYAIVNTSELDHPDYEFRYIVANNQYFYYPDGKRYNESTGEFYTPTDCTGYDYWPYGFEFAPAYIDGMTKEDLLQQQISRNTVYLLGTNDTQTEGTLNTTDCAAILLGSNRLERGRNIFTYFETFHSAENNHQKIEVEGVGHDASAMFNSDGFKQLISSN
ncbi:MAG: Ig-like domain-containing protein [Christiangramia sp.]|nr:Ig-like domain-containing protein [Christiangramia sp.]